MSNRGENVTPNLRRKAGNLQNYSFFWVYQRAEVARQSKLNPGAMNLPTRDGTYELLHLREKVKERWPLHKQVRKRWRFNRFLKCYVWANTSVWNSQESQIRGLDIHFLKGLHQVLTEQGRGQENPVRGAGRQEVCRLDRKPCPIPQVAETPLPAAQEESASRASL